METSNSNGVLPKPNISERLAEPEVTHSLNRLLDRLDSIDLTLSAVEEVGKKLPNILQDLQESQAHQKRLENGMRLLEKISEPEVTNALTRLLDKLDTVDTLLSAADEVTQKLPQVMSDLPENHELNKRLNEGLKLVEKMTEPETLRSLTGLMDKIETAELLINSAEALTQKLGELAGDLEQSPHREMLGSYLELGEKLTKPEVYHNLNNLLDKIENLDAVLNILDSVVLENPSLKDPNSPTLKNISELVKIILDSFAEEKHFFETIQGGLAIINEVNRILLSDKMQPIVRGLASAMEVRKDDVPKVGPLKLLRLTTDSEVKQVQGLFYLLLKSIGREFANYECKVPSNE